MISAIAVLLTAAGDRDRRRSSGGPPSQRRRSGPGPAGQPLDRADGPSTRPTRLCRRWSSSTGSTPCPTWSTSRWPSRVAESLARRGGPPCNVLAWDWNAATVESLRASAQLRGRRPPGAGAGLGPLGGRGRPGADPPDRPQLGGDGRHLRRPGLREELRPARRAAHTARAGHVLSRDHLRATGSRFPRAGRRELLVARAERVRPGGRAAGRPELSGRRPRLVCRRALPAPVGPPLSSSAGTSRPSSTLDFRRDSTGACCSRGDSVKDRRQRSETSLARS